MTTILVETLRSHLEMVTISLTIVGKLDKSAETAIAFQALASKLGADKITFNKYTTGAAIAGEIYVLQADKGQLAHFTVSHSGEVLPWLWNQAKTA